MEEWRKISKREFKLFCFAAFLFAVVECFLFCHMTLSVEVMILYRRRKPGSAFCCNLICIDTKQTNKKQE